MFEPAAVSSSVDVDTSQLGSSPSLPSCSTSCTDISDFGDHGIDDAFLEPELDGNGLEPIAICGFSVKFPQDATSPEAFWKMICERRCAMTDFPDTRFNKDGFYQKKKKRNAV
jgi:hypothetical protein